MVVPIPVTMGFQRENGDGYEERCCEGTGKQIQYAKRTFLRHDHLVGLGNLLVSENGGEDEKSQIAWCNKDKLKSTGLFKSHHRLE